MMTDDQRIQERESREFEEAIRRDGLHCVMCGDLAPLLASGEMDVETAGDDGWAPSYFDCEEEKDGPVCQECCGQFLRVNLDDGCLELCPEPSVIVRIAGE
jgi:hypothetical protein